MPRSDFYPKSVHKILSMLEDGALTTREMVAQGFENANMLQDALRRLRGYKAVDRVAQTRPDGRGREYKYYITETGQKRLNYLNDAWGMDLIQ